MKTEEENKKSKLHLKEFSKSGKGVGIHSLDNFREVGNYTWIAEEITDEMGFPSCVKDTDECHCCEGQLFVMRHGAKETNQSTDSFGQVLSIINHETGNSNIFIRSLSPSKNNGKWTPWQMVATGDPKLITENNSINEAFTTLREQVEYEQVRALYAEQQLSENIKYEQLRAQTVEQELYDSIIGIYNFEYGGI